MQLANFDNSCEHIEATCSKIYHQLRYEKNFPPEKRNEFDLILKHLFCLIHPAASYSFTAEPLWHTAYQIVRLTKLDHKIEKILQQIYTLEGPKFFCHKLKREVLPSLASRIHHLNLTALGHHRLPFNYGKAHAELYENAQKQITVVEPSNINSIERDVFHLLGNHLKENQLTQINLQTLTGSLEIYGLISWGQVLKAAIRKESIDQDKNAYQFLLNKIAEALPLATKLSYASLCIKSGKMKTDFPDKAYYEAVVGLNADQSVQLNIPKVDHSTFLGRYTLDQVSEIPIKIVENDIAWDMVQTIYQMKVGDVRIFSLGRDGHRLMVQITRMEEDSSHQMPMFKYEIFNTGEGISPFHRTVQLDVNHFVYPITYLNVPLNAFNFFFCAEIIAQSLRSPSIQGFYTQHDFYLTQLGVTKHNDLGHLYSPQKYGTCCYTGLEAWVDSHLTPEQNKKLELIKTQVSTEKQNQIVILLENNSNESSKEPVVEYLPFGNIIFKSKQKKLKESRLLLALVKQHLRLLESAEKN